MDRLTATRRAPTIRDVRTLAPSDARRALTMSAAAWALALPVASFAAASPVTASWPHAFASAIFAIGSFVCHQRPERSFALWGVQLPVCARCTGIYSGAALVAFLYAGSRESAAHRILSPFGLLVVAASPTAVTLAYEWLTGVTPSNAVRAMAGLPLGAAVLVVLLDELGRKP
jgi:uncharacterized membrane protein